MKQLTQNNKLAGAMRRRWVSPLDAFRLCGTLRFSGRVMELKAMGYTLAERWADRNGARVKEFKIV